MGREVVADSKARDAVHRVLLRHAPAGRIGAPWLGSSGAIASFRITEQLYGAAVVGQVGCGPPQNQALPRSERSTGRGQGTQRGPCWPPALAADDQRELTARVPRLALDLPRRPALSDPAAGLPLAARATDYLFGRRRPWVIRVYLQN